MPQLTLFLKAKVVEFWHRLNQPFKSSTNLDNSSTKQMLQQLEQYIELLLNFPLLELFAVLTKCAVIEREALDP